ncbi:MAG TPA: hypothetical protein VNI57_15020 [Candidatus Saccharimonadales bacterium]|nr:hypothetical protein [Candidatus Saccharimonadales bacterium]
MTHPSLEDLLAHRDGESPADVARHVDACEECAGEVARLREMASALRSLPSQRPPRDHWERIHSAIRQEERAWIPRAVAGTLIALAASFLVLVVLPREDTASPDSRSRAASARATDEEIAQLVAKSQRLEGMLRRAGGEVRVTDGWSANTVAELQDRIALVDSQLTGNAAAAITPQQRARLWRTRVDLMTELVRARTTRPQYVEF